MARLRRIGTLVERSSLGQMVCIASCNGSNGNSLEGLTLSINQSIDQWINRGLCVRLSTEIAEERELLPWTLGGLLEWRLLEELNSPPFSFQTQESPKYVCRLSAVRFP